MRLGVVTTSYPRHPGDAAGSFVAAHVDWMLAAGHDVEVIAAGDSDVREPDGATSRLRVIRVPAPPGLFYAGGAPDAMDRGDHLGDAAVFSARLAFAVRRHSARWEATCAHWLAPSALAAIATRGPLLAIAHGGDVHLLARAHLLSPAVAALLARRARIAFVSRALHRRAALALPRWQRPGLDAASIVQPMGVDLARFAAVAARRVPRPAGTPALIAVLARLVPIKGVAVAIEAMAHVRTPARLVIAGDGPLRDALTSQAVGKPIDFVGALGADDRDALLARADAVVVPSVDVAGRAEGMPLVALEALAARVPLVVADTGGLVDIPSDAAWHVRSGDAQALAAAIDCALAGSMAGQTEKTADWASAGARLWGHWLHR